MHQLIVLGNGFDLECGLKSRFSDFISKRAESHPYYASYFRRKQEKRKNIGSVILGLPDGRRLYDEGATIWEAILVATENGQWCDVESTIRDFFIQETCEEHRTRPALLVEYLRTFPHSINEESVIPEFQFGQSDAEFSVASKFLARRCLTSPTPIPDIPRTMPDLTEFLLNQLHELEYAFGHYINEERQNSVSYESQSIALMKSLSEDELSPDLDGSLPETSVLDFNYTNPADQYVREHDIHLVNIHGTTLKPIFGIDEKDVVSKPDLVQFTKTYRLLALNNPDRSKIIHTSTDSNGKPTGLIKFYGHSLGNADYSYFQAIFDGVDLYSSNTRLIFYYNIWIQDDGHYCKEEIAQQDMFRKVTRLMKEYGETMTNEDHGENLMHKLLLEGRLTIKRYNG